MNDLGNRLDTVCAPLRGWRCRVGWECATVRAVHADSPFGESGVENPKPSWRSTSNSPDVAPPLAHTSYLCVT